MKMIQENLEMLLKELQFKTPLKEIPPATAEIITNFLQIERDYRKQDRIRRLLRMSGIRQVKTLTQFDWHFNQKIAKDDILGFFNSPWVEQAFNLVLIGDTGLGKSHIAVSLCYEAILQGYSSIFISAFDLTSRIKKSINSGSKIDYYARVKVLCIDELGYTYHQKEDTDILFQIISKRTEILPTIVTTNLVPKQWGAIFSSPAASAILDRLSFNGKFITFEGSSYRLLKKHK